MASFASTDDIEDVWRPLSDQETVAASALLTRVSALMRLRVPGLDGRVGDSPDLAVIASGVAVDAVLRVLRNPDGKVSESIDDYTYRRSDAVADGSLYLSAEDIVRLSPAAEPLTGAYSVSLWGC